MADNTEGKPLFRKEAIEYQKTRWLGNALLIGSVQAWVILSCAIVVLLIFALFICFAQYTRRINVSGEVISDPHATNLLAPQQGFVTSIFFRPGQYVKKGSALVELDVSRNNQTGNVSQESVQAINQQLHSLKDIMSKLEQNKQSSLQSLNHQLKQQQIAQQQSIKIFNSAKRGESDMQKMANDYAQYLKQGLVNREQVNQLKYLYYEQQMSTENQNSKISQQNIQINEIQKEILVKSKDYDNQILQYQVQYNDLIRQLSEVKASDVLVIKAPRDGFLENMPVSPGQMVSQGDNLAQLSANQHANFVVVLWLPNNSIPYIQLGDQVNLRYEAFPYEKFGQFAGKIKSISHVPASDQELSQYGSAPKQGHASFYKVLVQPAQHQLLWQGRKISLAAGMQAQSTVFLESRPLYQWMIAPLYKIKTSVGGAVHE
jgi:membrane fusion protein